MLSFVLVTEIAQSPRKSRTRAGYFSPFKIFGLNSGEMSKSARVGVVHNKDSSPQPLQVGAALANPLYFSKE